MDTIYKEIILDHYRNPRNKRALSSAAVAGGEYNSLCGDEVSIFLNMDDDGVVTEITFDGDGCAVSQAVASLFTEHAKGKRIDDLAQFGKEDIEKLLGITLSPARMRCASLAVEALRNGLRNRVSF